MTGKMSRSDMDHELALAIQQELDGVEWLPETLETIALLLVNAGYRVRDMNDVDREV